MTLADLFDRRHVHPGTTVFVTTAHGVLSSARALGYAQKLEAAGIARYHAKYIPRFGILGLQSRRLGEGGQSGVTLT